MTPKTKQPSDHTDLQAIMQQLREENARLRRSSVSPSLLLSDHPETSSSFSNALAQGKVPSVKLPVKPKAARHLLITGDELASLTALQDSHHRSVDVVWVDMRVARSLHLATQSSTPYPLLGTDAETSIPDAGTPSTQMLAGLKRRLAMARRLMSQDGVMFLVVSDVELAHCKLVADSVFGAQNFIADMAWRSGSTTGGDSSLLSPVLEHILVIARDKDRLSFATRPSASYRLTDEHEEARGKHALLSMDSSSLTYHKSLDYPVVSPDGVLVYAGGASRREWQARQKNPALRKDWCWRWPQERLAEGMEKGFVVVHRDRRGDYRVRFKQYQRVTDTGRIVDRSSMPTTLIEGIPARNGARETRELLGAAAPAARPLELFSHLLSLIARKNAVILDVFSDGACGQAVAAMNADDSGTRTAILLADETADRSRRRVKHPEVPGTFTSTPVRLIDGPAGSERVASALALLGVS